MPDTQVTTIDLLRHGQTQADDILRGRIDVPLSAEGYLQMQQRIEFCIDPQPPWQQLICSPLQRCAHFADDLSQQHGSPLSREPGFIEMDFGDWDGLPLDQLRADNPKLFDNVWRQPEHFTPPNGETLQQFTARIRAAWQALLKHYQGQHLLLVTHGGVIRALLAMVMQLPQTALSCMEVPFACMSRIKVYHRQDHPDWPQLVFHNKP
jgi:broad specificity phosphatase PhoE